ncbi:CDGP domain-containing protein [Mycobacterium sp. NPDC050041]|uniref:CDGP domain-containing protein n=1 Tax=Mycobacterium sp. NPDC050041 TaxID=3364293 RepID=UPI003C2B52EB
MKRWIAGGSAALLMAVPLITAAPPAAAGCLYGGPVISKCDGPVQPGGTWQRCVAVAQWVPSGLGSHLVPVKHCNLMGPGQPGGDPGFNDPPVRIAP